MNFFDKAGEWLYANFSSEYEENAQLHREVAEAQLANQRRLYDEGKVDFITNYFMEQEIEDAGEFTAKAREKDASLANLLSGVPWWAWLLMAIGVWIYLGAPGLKKLKGKFA